MTGTGQDVVRQAHRFMPGVEHPGAQFYYDWDAALPKNDEPRNAECSNLAWSAATFGGGVSGFPDGSYNQFATCDQGGGRIPIDQALRTPGALVFKTKGNRQDYPPRPGRDGIVHVAVCVGDGRTVYEACCSTGDPIRPRTVDTGTWYRWGGLIPGVRYDPDSPTHDQEEDDMAVTHVFWRNAKGTIYEHDVHSGSSWGIPDLETLAARKELLSSLGVQWRDDSAQDTSNEQMWGRQM